MFRCPFCLHKDTLFRTYTFSKDEESATFKCNKCDNIWKIYYWRRKWRHAQNSDKSVKNYR